LCSSDDIGPAEGENWRNHGRYVSQLAKVGQAFPLTSPNTKGE
jgi:hypothetical protein